MQRHLVVALFIFSLSCSVSCSEQTILVADVDSVQLTRESLDSFTAYLTGDSTDPHSARIPADLAAEKSNWKLWMKYIIGSATVLGSVDKRALSVIRRLWGDSAAYWMCLLEELDRKNDLDTVVHFIARNARALFRNTTLGSSVMELMGENSGATRRLFSEVLAVLREDEYGSNEYECILRRMPIELQYQRIDSGQVPLDEIDKVYLSGKPPYSLLRRIFFQARCSPTPNPEIREYIAERVPWLKQFLPDAPNELKDTAVTSIVEPGHDVWFRILSFMDAETLIFVCPLVCQTWNKSYSKMLAEDTRIQEWFLQDLSHVIWSKIHTIAPWKHFLNGNNSGLYLGQCIISGAIGRAELDDESNWEIRGYLQDTISGKAPIPNAGKETTRCESFAKLIEEGYKAYPCRMPTLCKPPFLTDKEYENVIHHLVCRKKLAITLSFQWMIDNVRRIYSIIGDNQALIKEVIDLSVNDYRVALPFWIMIGQACGIADDTAKLVFDKPGTFTQKFIRPVVVKPSEYYDHIVESGMLFEMLKAYYERTLGSCSIYGLYHLVISLILSFKYRPDKIEKIVASMTSQPPTLREDILRSIEYWLGMKALDILKTCDKYPPEDVEFAKRVLTRCGLL